MKTVGNKKLKLQKKKLSDYERKEYLLFMSKIMTKVNLICINLRSYFFFNYLLLLLLLLLLSMIIIIYIINYYYYPIIII